jgi:hypothetical protein
MPILPMAIPCLLRKSFFSSTESGSTSIAMVIWYKPLLLRRSIIFGPNSYEAREVFSANNPSFCCLQSFLPTKNDLV